MQQGMAGLAAQQQQRNGVAGAAQGANPMSGQVAPNANANMPPRHPGQNMAQNGMPNGTPNGMQMGLQMPHAQMQGMQGQRMPNISQEQMRIMMQQRQLVAAQNPQNQQQCGMQHPRQSNGLAAAHLSPANGTMPNQQMLAALAAQRASGMANGLAGGAAAGPRPPQGMGMHKSQLSSGMTPTITYFQHKAQQQYPQFSPEDINKIAQEQLKSHLQRMTATAASAAAGMPTMMNNGVAQMGSNAFAQQAAMLNNHSPQQYQAQLHRQMQHQQARLSGSPGLNPAQQRPVSRSATPQGAQAQAAAMMHQRSGSGTAMSHELSDSPRLPTAQMTRP